MLMDAPRFRAARDPFDTDRARGHRHVGGPLARDGERHWLIAAVVVAVVAASVSAYASYEAGQTQRKIGEYNAKVAKNAALAQRQAAAIAAENERDKARVIMAAQRAGIGAAGVLPSEGTPLLVQTDTAERAALNEARIRYSGEVNARAQEAEAIIQGYAGKAAARRGYIEAGASLLSGASTAAGAYGRSGSSGRSTASGDTFNTGYRT